MPYAMMGDIIMGTVLTLLIVPALYVAWFRIKAPDRPSELVHETIADRPRAIALLLPS